MTFDGATHSPIANGDLVVQDDTAYESSAGPTGSASTRHFYRGLLLGLLQRVGHQPA